ncbi:MAG: hypothetical protein ABH873_08295 [Candidatus Firestonebacteria bacterium]
MSSMNSVKEVNKDTEFLWDVFENTGLIGVYLMYEEKDKETSYKNLEKRTLKNEICPTN